MLVSNVFRIPAEKLTDGEVGIEVEVEGKSLPKTDPKIWAMTSDGSLKAEEAVEYVLARPMPLEEATEALRYLERKYRDSKSVVDESIRAGVHIHINVQKLNLVQLYTFITTYLLLEELLVRWCGESREGNLFCLRAGDAEWVLKKLTKAVRTYDFYNIFHDDDIRYASINAKAITEHGSLEFRSMRSTRDLALVNKWMRMLHKILQSSLRYDNPIEVVTTYSHENKKDFVSSILGAEDTEELFATHDPEGLLFSGMRAAQDVAYATDNWGELLNIGSTNPFKRGEISVRPDPLEMEEVPRVTVEGVEGMVPPPPPPLGGEGRPRPRADDRVTTRRIEGIIRPGPMTIWLDDGQEIRR